MQRWLAGFDPRTVPLYHFDVVVVGAGIAGGATAIEAARRGARVALLAKSDLDVSNTWHAKGGLATVLGPGDSFASHVRDTLEVGCELCEEDVVETVVGGGPRGVDFLLELGARFDRERSGQLALSREGGHAHARILHAGGDSTGAEIQRSLSEAVRRQDGIRLFTRSFVADILLTEAGRACGVVVLGEGDRPVGFLAREVVLATGGAGQLYRETTNPVIATGDGVALGFRAGAAVRDLEFFQFHPTCLYIAGAARVLISEVVRGAGGVLRDRHGRRFMPDYHRDAELAPRDVVSRAVFDRMVATGDTSVYLDLRELATDPHALFPGISTICRFFGIDIARDPIPVRPGAHYMVGGLTVDRDARTTIAGLSAVGECASSGLHGANRMGSNSLLEGLVLGRALGERLARELSPASENGFPSLARGRQPREAAGFHVNLADVTYSLKSLMWRQMGVMREAQSLADALQKIELWSRAVEELGPVSAETCELLNMLCVARLATQGAITREESRGVHQRTDHPERDARWRAHVQQVARIDGASIVGTEISRTPVRALTPIA
ncbi:MAG: L-aspartate oxidase [Planctomycetota bacterium]|nr:MAG: L-aspartate oxidase [Planctomycetota bacterium]